jgi:hypothetical protein
VPSPAAQRVTALFLIGERADRAVAAFQTVGPLTQRSRGPQAAAMPSDLASPPVIVTDLIRVSARQ